MLLNTKISFFQKVVISPISTVSNYAHSIKILFYSYFTPPCISFRKYDWIIHFCLRSFLPVLPVRVFWRGVASGNVFVIV